MHRCPPSSCLLQGWEKLMLTGSSTLFTKATNPETCTAHFVPLFAHLPSSQSPFLLPSAAAATTTIHDHDNVPVNNWTDQSIDRDFPFTFPLSPSLFDGTSLSLSLSLSLSAVNSREEHLLRSKCVRRLKGRMKFFIGVAVA